MNVRESLDVPPYPSDTVNVARPLPPPENVIVAELVLDAFPAMSHEYET
jgi:hypothetical protein